MSAIGLGPEASGILVGPVENTAGPVEISIHFEGPLGETTSQASEKNPKVTAC